MSNDWLDSKVPIVPPMGRARIEVETDGILRSVLPEALTGEAPVDVEYIFEIELPKMYQGLTVGYCDLSALGPGVMGYTSAKNKVCLVEKKLYDLACLPDAKESDIRRFRSTVAHETSHAVFHYPFLNVFESANTGLAHQSLMRVEKRKDIPAYKDPEWQAWQIAGALLMPYERVVSDIERGLGRYELAEIYNVNPAFAQQRINSILKQK